MPVLLDSYAPNSPSENCLHIGLINNMGDEALKATERQYLSLLDGASDGMQVRLSLYTLPGISRGENGTRHVASLYSSIEEMWDGQLDGLIVTGREPWAADFADEPYWEGFTRTLAWAQENVQSTVWSCLAAHAAVFHMSGIRRTRLSEKLFGIFPCLRVEEHPLIAQAPHDLALPHSRWNSLPIEQLTDCGYTILTRANDLEVDTFISQQEKLFVFFQGHPEYEADTLLREYRRDIARYFKGETAYYPSMPRGYFDDETAAILKVLEQESTPARGNELLPSISAALGKNSIGHTWRSTAGTIYENWLRHIRAQKSAALRSKSVRRIRHTNPSSQAANALFDTAIEA